MIAIEPGLKQLLGPTAADGTSCPPHALYRYASGDASPAEQHDFERHLLGCEGCAADLATLKALAPTPRAPWRSWLVLGPAIAALALLIVGGLWRGQQSTLQIKGGYTLHVAVERGGQRFTAESGAPLEVGDRLGFFYTAPQSRWLSLWAISHEGEVSRVWPEGAVSRVEAGAELRIPTGGLIDASEGCEWLVAVFSHEAPELEAIEAALRHAYSARRECTLALDLSAPSSVFILRTKP